MHNIVFSVFQIGIDVVLRAVWSLLTPGQVELLLALLQDYTPRIIESTEPVDIKPVLNTKVVGCCSVMFFLTEAGFTAVCEC